MKIIALVLLLSSCSQKVTPEQCDIWGLETFRGKPNAAHEYKKNCQEMDHLYKPDLCQKALVDVGLGMSLPTLEKKYGSRVGECFNQDQHRQFFK